MTRKLIIGLVLIAAIVAAAWVVIDKEFRDCTAVGCDSQIQVTVKLAPRDSPAENVRVCIDGECEMEKVRAPMPTRAGKFTILTFPCDAAENVPITSEVRDEEGREISTDSAELTTRAIEPNGDGCPPTCFIGLADLDAETGRLVVN